VVATISQKELKSWMEMAQALIKYEGMLNSDWQGIVLSVKRI